MNGNPANVESEASSAEDEIAHESVRRTTSSPDVGEVDEDTRTKPNQGAKGAPDSGTQTTNTSHQEPTSQRSSPQNLPRTPRNQSETATGLPTPSQTRLRSTSEYLSARSRQGAPTRSAAKPLDGAVRSPQVFSAPLPRASTPTLQTASQPSIDGSSSQPSQSPVNNAPTNALEKGKVTFSESQAYIKEAEDRLRAITADQVELDSRLLNCQALLAAPIINDPNIKVALQAVAKEMAKPYEELLMQKEKASALQIEAKRLYDELTNGEDVRA